MAFYEKIIDLAKTQVGYHEGRDASGWNNDQKYSEELPGFGWSDGKAWCATFNSWLDWKVGLTAGAGDTAKSPCTASVLTAYEWGKQHNRFTEYPVLGAWIIFRVSEHTERCVAFDTTYVWSIGGNTNNNYSPQGDGVYFKKYLRTDSRITGYVVPVFPDGAYKSPDPRWNTAVTTHVVDMTGGSTPATPTTTKPGATARPSGNISLSELQNGLKSGKPTNSMKIIQYLLNASQNTKAAGYADIPLDEAHGGGTLTKRTQFAMAHYQRAISNSNHLGWTSADCDGVPGTTSVRGLASWGKVEVVA